jgi:RNA polymerase sigma-70 factor (ECF subfamily)
MLGSSSEAEDAVQESWLRLSRSGSVGVENLGGWLTTVVARVCLDMLRSRKARREEPWGPEVAEPVVQGVDPEGEVVLADSVGLALLVVLDTLAPAERVAFVLHDLFAVPFEEIGPIVGRSAAATRQLASRARRRVQSVDGVPEVDVGRRRVVVEAFLAASRSGDFEALLAVLDPDVVVRADRAAVALGSDAVVRGPAAVAGTFAGRALAARLALVDGLPGLVWAPGGRPKVVFGFAVVDDKIVAIDLLADAEDIAGMSLEMLEN